MRVLAQLGRGGIASFPDSAGTFRELGYKGCRVSNIGRVVRRHRRAAPIMTRGALNAMTPGCEQVRK